VGLAWRRTSPRKVDFNSLGDVITKALGVGARAERDYSSTSASSAARSSRQ